MENTHPAEPAAWTKASSADRPKRCTAATRLARSRRRPAKSGLGPSDTSDLPTRYTPCGCPSPYIPSALSPRAPRPCRAAASWSARAKTDEWPMALRPTNSEPNRKQNWRATTKASGTWRTLADSGAPRRYKPSPRRWRRGGVGARPACNVPAPGLAAGPLGQVPDLRTTGTPGKRNRDRGRRAWTAVALDLYLPPSCAARFSAPRAKPPVIASAPASPRIKAKTERTRLTYWTRLPAQRQITTMRLLGRATR